MQEIDLEMNFQDVMAALDAGLKVRRQRWKAGRYWCLIDGSLYQFKDGEKSRVREIPWERVQAKDWELYNEEQSKDDD